MPCYKPLQACYSESVNVKTGKRVINFLKDSFTDSSLIPVEDRLLLPCGKCIGCRLERSRQWALRCVHEAELWSENCFITLTYSDENLPEGGTLVKKDFQDFMKRFRKRFSGIDMDQEGNFPIRFFHCGEYGEKYGRPHYHAAIFNFIFDDLVLFKSKMGIKLYTSPSLQELWPHGFVTVGALTFESAAYVARYIMKKRYGAGADEHYDGRLPEYITMSRRPGIGAGWFEKFSSDVYPSDTCVIRGRVCKPPRFYDKLLESDNKALFDSIKESRKDFALSKQRDNVPERLQAREKCKELQVKRLIRELDLVL